jgi:hypothetical protein
MNWKSLKEAFMNQFHYDFTENEIGTLLAALRYYQHSGLGNRDNHPTWLREIATNGEEFIPLNNEDLDRLCEKLNFEG